MIAEDIFKQDYEKHLHYLQLKGLQTHAELCISTPQQQAVDSTATADLQPWSEPGSGMVQKTTTNEMHLLRRPDDDHQNTHSLSLSSWRKSGADLKG